MKQTNIVAKINSSNTQKYTTVSTLFGEEQIVDLRCAGDSAQESGKRFEDITEKLLIEGKRLTDRYYYDTKPKFKCHFDLPREGDFLIKSSNSKRTIHVECKQLGDVHSHFDKLSHCLMSAISGCYGNEFWLVYDYNRITTKSSSKKIIKLIKRCKQIKDMCLLQGITFELILIDDLPNYLAKI